MTATAPDVARVIPTSAGPMGAIVQGSGPTVVLLHGVTDNAATWIPIQRELAPEACLHAVDLPGHGASFFPDSPLTIEGMADAVIAYLDAAHISDCLIVGNSLGGGVALGVCARATTRVRGAILLGTIGAPFRPVLGIRLLGHPWVAARLAGVATHSTVRSLIVRRGFPFRYRPTPEMVSRYWEGWLVPGRAQSISAFISVMDVGEPWPWLPKIQQPVHVIHGTRDSLVPRRVARAVASALPHGSLTMWRGISHMPQHDATAAVCDAIREALREGSPHCD